MTVKKRRTRRYVKKRRSVKRKPAREYEPDLPSDARETLVEKLLLGEELAQYSFGAMGSHTIHI